MPPATRTAHHKCQFRCLEHFLPGLELAKRNAVSARAALRVRHMDAPQHLSDVERSDADPRLIAALAAGIAIFLAASPFVLRLAYPTAPEAAAIEGRLPHPVPPPLEVKPKRTLEAQRSREDELLGSYG